MEREWISLPIRRRILEQSLVHIWGKPATEVLYDYFRSNCSYIFQFVLNDGVLTYGQGPHARCSENNIWPFFRWNDVGFVKRTNAEMPEIENGQRNSYERKIQNPIFVREMIEKSTQQKRDKNREHDGCRHAHNWLPWLPFCLALGAGVGFVYALFLIRRTTH